MEQLSQTGSAPTPELTEGAHHEPAVPPDPESWDERVIREGIQAAVTEGRPIDDRTARYIAGQLHGGQSSALYSLASSGAVRSEVFAELNNGSTGSTDQPEHVRGWLTSLTIYCELRGE